MYHMHTLGASICMHVVHSVGFAMGVGDGWFYLRVACDSRENTKSSPFVNSHDNLMHARVRILWVLWWVGLLSKTHDIRCDKEGRFEMSAFCSLGFGDIREGETLRRLVCTSYCYGFKDRTIPWKWCHVAKSRWLVGWLVEIHVEVVVVHRQYPTGWIK